MACEVHNLQGEGENRQGYWVFPLVIDTRRRPALSTWQDQVAQATESNLSGEFACLTAGTIGHTIFVLGFVYRFVPGCT